MKKILLPTDFSETSKNAIRCALRYFADTPVEFVLLNALGARVSSTGVAQSANLILQTEAKLRELEKKILSEDGFIQHTFRVVALAMEPKTAIKLLVQNESFDWVVVGTTGFGNAVALGSIATALIRINQCNVLVVPFSQQPTPLLNVVLATDYQPLGINAIKSLHELVSIHHAELTFLTILADDTLTTAPEKSIRDAYQAEFADLNTNEVIESHVCLRAGIDDYIDSHYVDLLVTVCHHRSFLDVLLNRSLTRQLAYQPLLPLAILADKESKPVTLVERSVKGDVLLRR
ncbi:hypothetical protein BH09BAC4_BH09BAC4_13970 [soil metagenome]